MWAHRQTGTEDSPGQTEHVPSSNRGPDKPVAAYAIKSRWILKRPLPRKRGHRHNPNSRWSQKHSLYQKARDEVAELYNFHVHRDPELGEVVALKESVLLDVDVGEVLRRGLVYQRRFDVFSRG